MINKSDRVKDKAILMPVCTEGHGGYPFCGFVPVSATLKFQLDGLEREINHYLPEEIRFSMRTISLIVAKISGDRNRARKSYFVLSAMVPYTTVVMEKFEQEGQLRRVFVAILVDRDGHKSMVIGNKGARLKKFPANLDGIWKSYLVALCASRSG